MPYTNFPFGVTSMGIPLVGGAMPPFTGKYLFVNETTGSDGNTGEATAPLATITRALALCGTGGNNDVIFITGTIHATASIAWNLNQTHLVGLCEPLMRGKRARISVSGSTPFSYLFNVSGSGCWFSNFSTFYGFPTTGSTTPVCWLDTGGRNCYDNVEFMGFGDGTAVTGTAVQTGARAFKLNTSTGETTFRNCVFGVDTIARNATNYTFEFAGGAPRCYFENCTFEADLGSSGGGSSHVLCGTGGIDRYCQFDNCKFLNDTLGGVSGTVMAQIFNVPPSPGGAFLLHRCTGFGATHWETASSGFVLVDMPTVTTHDSGLAVAATPS